MSCDSRHVVYLISCRQCGFQYVGETSQLLRCRINQHRACIRRPNPTTLIFFFIYYLTRLQSQKSKLWSFLAVRVLALSRPEVSASSNKQRTKRERGGRRKKNMYSQFRKTARCLDERCSKLGLFKSHDQ